MSVLAIHDERDYTKGITFSQLYNKDYFILQQNLPVVDMLYRKLNDTDAIHIASGVIYKFEGETSVIEVNVELNVYDID